MAAKKQRSFEPRTTFRFKAYLDLKRTLGRINVAVEIAELAMRSFESHARVASSANTFIKEMSIAHGVRVDSLELPSAILHMHHFHIVSVHQQFEVFLKAFKKEHPLTTWANSEDTPLLKNVLSSFAPRLYNDMVEAIGRLELDVADYYSKVRNAVAHGDDKNSAQSTLRLREQVQDAASVYRRLSAPNSFSQITFDDFILFTRVVKHIALALCTVARPTDSQIAQMILQVDQTGSPGVDLRVLARKKRSLEARSNALGTLLRIKYGLSRPEAQPIVDLLLNGPQALR